MPPQPAGADPGVRKVSGVNELLSNLGPLQDLPGLWSGTGFNLIARPDFAARSVPTPGEPAHLFLELNFTLESLKFDFIGSPIPNRGFAQSDINLFGVHYLQQISDRNTGGALHIEPGIWVNVPATTTPAESASIARMASIPHGTVMLAEGQANPATPGGPNIPVANTAPFGVQAPTPFPGGQAAFPQYDLTVVPPNPAAAFRTPAADIPEITQEIIDNPNSLLTAALQGFAVLETTTLNVATVGTVTTNDGPAPLPPAPQPGTTTVPIPDGGGGTENLPFLEANATAATVFATFWIEKIQDPFSPDRHFMQLQYSQTVLLNFPLDVAPTSANPAGSVNLSWPHVSVATLVKQF